MGIPVGFPEKKRGGYVMDYLVYLVYPLLAVALLWGSSLKKRGEWNEEVFSLRQMKAMQGFIALCILLHHCGQKTSASWIDQRYYVPGLDFFVPIGYILVSFFTFASGYGLYKSFHTKPHYLEDHFFRKRVVPILGIGYTVCLVYLAVRLALGEQVTGQKLLWYLTGLKLCNPNSWYVYIMPLFYLAFFLAFRFIKDERKALAAVLLFTIAYQLLGASIDHNDWIMRGEWWYNSIHLFVVGLFVAKHETAILEHLKKHYVRYLVLGILGVLLFTGFTQFAKSFFSYYGENWGAPDKVLRRIICLISEILVSSSVVFTAYLIGMKLRIGNRFLAFLGRMTLEFYLIHGVFVELFCYSFAGELPSLYYIRNNGLFVLVVFALGLPSAMLLKKVGDLFRLSPSKAVPPEQGTEK